ncbi:unnamed protein product [Closterium sp. NIES-53]
MCSLWTAQDITGPVRRSFATVEDLISHLRTCDARYRATIPAEFLERNQPPMFITLYFIVTRLPDSLRSIKDHFLSLDTTSLTIDLIEQHLIAAETSAVAVGAARGTPRPPFFEGCSPSPLAPSYASAAAADVSISEDFGAASASAKRHSSKGKGGKGGGGGSSGGGGGSVSGGGGSSGGGGGSGRGGDGRTSGGSGGSDGGGGGSGGSGGSGGGGTGGSRTGPRHGGPGGGQRQQQQCRSETQSPQQIREWLFQHGTSGGSDSYPYVIRMGVRAGQTCGKLHTQHRCFSRLDDAWRAEFGDDVKLPRWADLLSAEGDCYQCLPPDPGIAAAALGASESGTLPSTAPAQALHTFMLDSGASRCFFRDSTTLTPLPAPVPARLVDPSGGPGRCLFLHCPPVSGGSVRLTVRSSPPLVLYELSEYRCPPGCDGSSLYTLATEPPQVAASAQVSASGQVAASCSCRLLSHQTILWHHRLGHPSLPRLRGMHSRLLVCGLPRSLPPLPPSPAPPCLPCVEGQQRAAPHSSSFPPTTAPLQALHMDVTFLSYVCTLTGVSFMLSDSPQRNGIAERRIGLVMEVACTSMIHAAASHFLWPFAVRYAAHQLNLWPRVSLPETSPTLRWTGEVGDASVFRFYHPTLRRILPSQDVTFDESIPFYCLFLYRSVPPPPPPLFLAPGPPPIDPLPPQGPSPSGVSKVDPLPGTAPIEVAVGSGAAPGAAASEGAEPRGAGSEGARSWGVEPGGEEPRGAEPEGGEPWGAESEGAESGGAEPQDAASSAGLAGASPRLSPQQLREWLVRHARLWSGAPRAGGAGVTAGAGGTRGTATAGPGGARTKGAGVAGTGGVWGAGAGDPTEPGAAGAGGSCTGGAGAGGAGAGGAGVGGTGAGGAGAAGAGAVDPKVGDAIGTMRPRPRILPLQPASPLPGPSLYTEQSGGLTERHESASFLVSPVRTAPRTPRLRPPPVPGTHTMALRPSSVPLRVPLPAHPESSLPEVPDPVFERVRAASPTVSRLLATAVTDPSYESATASALVAELLEFSATCRLDYATALGSESASVSPPSVGGECALGMDVLEDRQEDFECLAAVVPRFASMLLASKGDLDEPDIPILRSYAEAITGLDSSKWQAAMDAKMASWKSTGTYVDEVPPPGANIVDGMWIFRVKRPPGSPPAFKARYVARGFSQRQGVDYFQTFSPTSKMTTFRVLLHVAAQRDYELHSLDFSTAFLQGSLREEIWLRRSPDFTGSFPADTSLPSFYVLVYVDDLVFATADTEALTLVKSKLQKRHTCIDLGELRNYLGFHITRDRARRTITLTQSHMVHQVLQCFGFQFSSPQPTPLCTGHSLSAPPSDDSVEPSGPHPKLVGCLMYLMTCTRPDLAYPLSLLARYVATGRHRKVHWDAAKRVLRYLCSTSGMGLVLGGRGPVDLTGHADASWVDDAATQRSSQVYTFSLGSGSVSWRSTRSSSVLSSICEAEIYAGAMAAQELHWLTYLRTDLGEQPRSPPQRSQIRLAYVAIRANTVDIFTKALQPGDHQRFCTMLGLVPTLPHLLTV